MFVNPCCLHVDAVEQEYTHDCGVRGVLEVAHCC